MRIGRLKPLQPRRDFRRRNFISFYEKALPVARSIRPDRDFRAVFDRSRPPFIILEAACPINLSIPN
jgi:hypothetical protein